MRKHSILIVTLTLLLASCSSNKTDNEKAGTDTTIVEKSIADKSISSIQRFPAISFSLKNGSTFFRPELRDSGIYALKVAASILNSQEFRDSISKYIFPCQNHGYHCPQKCKDCDTGKISTLEIFDSLYYESNVSLTLELKGCGGGKYGETSENTYLISPCYYTVYDDKQIPFTYCYAGHICHEYMHHIGFFHFEKARKRNRDTDIAEKTGWIAYDILVRWYKTGIKPF